VDPPPPDPRTHVITVRQILHHIWHHIGGWCAQGHGYPADCTAPDPMIEPRQISHALGIALRLAMPPGPDDIVQYVVRYIASQVATGAATD
jgi:hypothetical protein